LRTRHSPTAHGIIVSVSVRSLTSYCSLLRKPAKIVSTRLEIPSALDVAVSNTRRAGRTGSIRLRTTTIRVRNSHGNTTIDMLVACYGPRLRLTATSVTTAVKIVAAGHVTVSHNRLGFARRTCCPGSTRLRTTTIRIRNRHGNRPIDMLVACYGPRLRLPAAAVSTTVKIVAAGHVTVSDNRLWLRRRFHYRLGHYNNCWLLFFLFRFGFSIG
jgi:hypothetical protein